jgi:hypothetical protein
MFAAELDRSIEMELGAGSGASRSDRSDQSERPNSARPRAVPEWASSAGERSGSELDFEDHEDHGPAHSLSSWPITHIGHG